MNPIFIFFSLILPSLIFIFGLSLVLLLKLYIPLFPPHICLPWFHFLLFFKMTSLSFIRYFLHIFILYPLSVTIFIISGHISLPVLLITHFNDRLTQRLIMYCLYFLAIQSCYHCNFPFIPDPLLVIISICCYICIYNKVICSVYVSKLECPYLSACTPCFIFYFAITQYFFQNPCQLKTPSNFGANNLKKIGVLGI